MMLKKFCCCCKLSTGAYCLGWIGAFITVLTIIGTITMFKVDYKTFVIDSTVDNMHAREELLKMEWIVKGLMIAYVFLLAIHFICCVCLIRGALNRAPHLIKPWLWLQGTCIVLGLLVALIVMMEDQNVLIGIIIYEIIEIYFFICIYSLFKSLMLQIRNKRQPAFNPHYERAV